MGKIQVLKSKIHRATVTQTELEYIGSITIDSELMETVNILPYEKVHVFNINSGDRFETYVIKGKPGKGEICINGAAARMAQKGDKVIIVSYISLDFENAKNWSPQIIKLDNKNKPI